jgi:hypothetical protein
MDDYLSALALLLEYLGQHPRLPDEHLTEVIRAYGPGLDGELEGERQGWRPFDVTRCVP